MMDSQFQFRILPMPEESGPFEPRLVWHHCSHTDPFLQWVRVSWWMRQERGEASGRDRHVRGVRRLLFDGGREWSSGL